LSWPFVAAFIALMAYSFLRARIRRWIVRRWVSDQLSNRSVAALFVGSYLAPLLALGTWVAFATPGASVPTVLITSTAIMVLVSGVFGLLEYASQRRIKDRLRRESGINGGSIQP
jgi:protein-S-isoprenylcysteine O-methyltransferase Ste14